MHGQHASSGTASRVNGVAVESTADPSTPLVHVLRNDLRLTGTRFGRGTGLWACSVLDDGPRTPSCDTPLWAVRGRDVQGVATALAQIAAAELDVDLARVTVRPVSTAHGPDEGVTSGSMSIVHSAAALRQACAEVRALLLAAAAAKLGRPADTLETRDGDIREPDGRVLVSYRELSDAVDLDRDVGGTARPRRPAGEALSPARLDLPDKVLGRPLFIRALALPGRVFGRVVRPTSRGREHRGGRRTGMSRDPRVEAALAHWGPRFVSGGVPLSDFEDVTAPVEKWDDRCSAWSARGKVHERHASTLTLEGVAPRVRCPADGTYRHAAQSADWMAARLAETG